MPKHPIVHVDSSANYLAIAKKFIIEKPPDKLRRLFLLTTTQNSLYLFQNRKLSLYVFIGKNLKRHWQSPGPVGIASPPRGSQ